MTFKRYHGTHWYWDDEDREYQIWATWTVEKNYPELPDYFSLEEIEVKEQEPNAPDLDLSVGGPVWKWVWKDGPDQEDTKEVDYL